MEAFKEGKRLCDPWGLRGTGVWSDMDYCRYLWAVRATFLFKVHVREASVLVEFKASAAKISTAKIKSELERERGDAAFFLTTRYDKSC